MRIFGYFVVDQESNKSNTPYVLNICISFLVHVSVENICIVKRKELRITLRRGYSSFYRSCSQVEWSNGQYFPILSLFIFWVIYYVQFHFLFQIQECLRCLVPYITYNIFSTGKGSTDKYIE